MCMRGRGGCGSFRGVAGVGWFLGVSKWLASDCKWMGYWFCRGITGDNSEWHRIGGSENSVVALISVKSAGWMGNFVTQYFEGRRAKVLVMFVTD